MKTLDVVCPVFGEEAVIELFHEKLCTVLEMLSVQYDWHIIYVLDPSPDATEEILAGISSRDPRVEVLVMSRRFGHQAALIAGLDHSRADAVVMLDSDLQHPPELLPRLMAHWEEGAEIVQTIREDSAETNALKRWTSLWFYGVFSKFGTVELRTGAADYRLLSRRVVQVFRSQMREHNPFLRGLVSWVGFKIVYVPFTPSRRHLGWSKYRASALMNFALNGVCSFSKLPLRSCIAAGFTFATLSVVTALFQVSLYFTSGINVPGWASLFSAVTFIGGIQLFFLGVLGEYVSLIFDEVKGRPRYLLDRLYASREVSAAAEVISSQVDPQVAADRAAHAQNLVAAP
jgi:polyisoprenyl-phosphate glycosyltransferase